MTSFFLICTMLMTLTVYQSKAQQKELAELKTRIDFSNNLVPNHSFEKFRRCPPHCTIVPKSYFVDSWTMPTIGTPDYFNACAYDAGVPSNWAGYMRAKTGNGYVGIISGKYKSAYPNVQVREYIQTKLKKPMEKHKKYYISYSVALAQNSRYAINGIELGLNHEKTDIRTFNGPIEARQRIPSGETHIISNKQSWKEISEVYQAKGGEEYIILGNFNPDSLTPWILLSDGLSLEYAYYLIDDVYVIPLKDNKEVTDAPGFLIDTLVNNQVMVWRDIRFEFDKSRLKKMAYKPLNQLVHYLQTHPDLFIQVSGHTDELGSDEYNYRLSLERAKSVAVYLINKGIEEKRISYKGFGNDHPVASNDTEENRALNRRVEFKISKKK